MNIIVYKCTKCGAIQYLPDMIEEPEPCMYCNGQTKEKE